MTSPCGDTLSGISKTDTKVKDLAMQSSSLLNTLEQTMTLTEIVPAARKLPVLDRLKLIRILAEDLETTGDIFPFESGKTYALPTPYNSFGAATVLAEAMAQYETRGEG
jgi:hypothetical protein